MQAAVLDVGLSMRESSLTLTWRALRKCVLQSTLQDSAGSVKTPHAQTINSKNSEARLAFGLNFSKETKRLCPL
jgi:hypothetical protein